jgi:hypothetical protein
MNELVPQTIETAGPVLWQTLTYGMRLDDVRKALPVVGDYLTSDDTLAGGAACLLRLDDYEIGSHSYAVHFYFVEDRLVQVTVKSRGGAGDGDFANVVLALRGRYGSEIAQNKEGMFWTADWIAAGGANINVTYSAAIDCLNINYQMRLLRDAAKL